MSDAVDEVSDAVTVGAGFDLCFDLSVVPSLLLDLAQRKIIRVNQAALTTLGMEEADVLGRPGADFLLEPTEDDILRVRGLRGDRTVAVRAVRTAFGPRVAELNVLPTGIDDIVFVQAIDLTDLLEAARSSEDRFAELSRKTKALESIAATLAHDLRSPMTSIAGFAALLRDRGESVDPAQRRDIADRIASSAHALASLTESMLADAQVRATDVPHDSRTVEDLLRLVQDATAAEFKEAVGQLSTSSSVDLLPVPVGVLSQPLLNVVSNSVKYRDPSRPLRVGVTVGAAPGGGVCVEVLDNGRGFGPDPEALLTSGSRGPSAEGTVGNGLGLSMVQTALGTLGGSLELVPQPEGALVRLIVPPPSTPPTRRSDDSVGGRSFEIGLTATQLSSVLDASPVPTVVLDLDRREIVRVNDAVVEVLGRPRSDIVGHAGHEFLQEPEVAAALRAAALAAPGRFNSSDVGVVTATGTLRAKVSLAAVPNSVLAVAQVVPHEVVVGSAPGLRTIASIASAGAARGEELGVEGLVDLLHRIAGLSRSSLEPEVDR